MRDAEEALVKAFVARDQRERSLSLLATPRGRDKLVTMLAHRIKLDMRFAQAVPPSERRPDDILILLRKHQAPEKCYVLSEWREIDGREMDLLDALRMVVGRGMGTFLSCIPGKLAYFEAETPGERYILSRK